jgi:hypothetical protein
MKIQIKNRYCGSILFEYESENNSIKETLIQGIKSNAYLVNANLVNANLGNANLVNAYLGNANLENANLENANLENAYLVNANLENANLENANLVNANLVNANLGNAKLPIFAKWYISIVGNKIIKIGCKQKTIEDWDLWFSGIEEYDTKRGTDDFKRIYASYLAHKAYLTHLNS